MALVLGLGWAHERGRVTAPKAAAAATVPSWSTSVSRVGVQLATAAMICQRSAETSEQTAQRGSCYGRVAPRRVHRRRFVHRRYGQVAATYTAPWRTKVKAKIIRRALHISRQPGGHKPIHTRKAAWHWFNSHDTCYIPAGAEFMDCRDGRARIHRLTVTDIKILRCGSMIGLAWAIGITTGGAGAAAGGVILGSAKCAWDQWDGTAP